MTNLILFQNVHVLDVRHGRRRAGQVLVEGDAIRAVSDAALPAEDARVIDGGGRTLMPGLIDCHAHVTFSQTNLALLADTPQTTLTLRALPILRDMLARGFTTVRDAGGADWALKQAIDDGLDGTVTGPRLFVSGPPLSPTGGHGDFRPRSDRLRPLDCPSCGVLQRLASTRVVDGVDGVRRAVRELLQMGADQIKIMSSGGVASPTDPIDALGYSVEETRAIVDEAAARHSYVLAHAYTPAAIRRAVECGVRSIEHGNLLDVATARVMKEHGAYLVPTLVTYDALAAEGERLGWSTEMLTKLDKVRAAGLESVRIARAEGVPVVFGTDLLGHMHVQQNAEFGIRLQAMGPVEVLQSATITAARLLRAEGQIGQLLPGAWADLLVVDGDPTVGLDMLAAPATGIRLLMQGGRVVRSSLPS